MYKYILELKNRFILLLITCLSLVLVTYFYKEILLYVFVENDLFNNVNFKIYYFIFTDVLEVFSVYIQLILFISLQISFCYSLYHIFIFISSGLYINEYYCLKNMLIMINVVAFFSFVISKIVFIPIMWLFFIQFQNVNFISLHFEAKLNEYINFCLTTYYFFMLYSQIFILIIFLFNYLTLSFEYIKKFRKIYYYLFLLFSTLISPPDIFSQILISLTLIFFYELYIFIFILRQVLTFIF